MTSRYLNQDCRPKCIVKHGRDEPALDVSTRIAKVSPALKLHADVTGLRVGGKKLPPQGLSTGGLWKAVKNALLGSSVSKDDLPTL